MKRFLLFLLLPVSAFAQGIFIPSRTVTGVVNGIPRPIAGATVTVCAANTAGIPCSPALTNTVFKDQGLTVPLSNPFFADANGNYPQAALPGGVYTITESAPGFAGFSYQVSIACAPGAGCTITGPVTLGNGAAFSPVTFSNHNQMFWAGPGPTPTIDNAVAACIALVLPCWVEISPGYTGPESANLLTLSTGHKVYSGALNVTVLDRRGNVSGGQPNYPILFGGRLAGQLVRMGVNGWASSPTDSTGAATSINWVTGTMPSNGGAQNGSVSVIQAHDTVTVGTANVPFVGQDGECNITSTAFDFPVQNCYGVNGQTNINRANGAQNIINAVGHHSAVNSNVSTSGAVMVNSYGELNEAQSAGAARNYSVFNRGNVLQDTETQIHSLINGASTVITAATESGQTVTITTASCPYTVNQEVSISGVTPAGYNGRFFVTSACSGGVFTYFNPTSAGLGAGTVFGTVVGYTTQTTTYFRNTNSIEHKPLSDTVGWIWLTQAGAGAFRVVPGTAITSLIPHIFNGNINLINGLAISFTVPTIAAAGCGGAAASIVVANGTAAFKVNVGTTPGSACTLTFPAATTGWNVTCNDITTQSASVFVQKQTGAESTTSVTITNFSTAAAATAFVASDILKCTAFAD